ncbi:MAG: DUF4147 domain-containing protein [Dehalococcoidia bacterium]|nr:DUF4147 domain-containing protein [Dehalococcoidia bacterium]
MQEGSRAARLLALFRDIALPLADSYGATRRALLWEPEARVLVAGKRRYKLDSIRKIFLVGAGKAGVPMARAVTDVLQQDSLLWSRFAGGTVNVYRHQAEARIPNVRLFAADHPRPNDASVEGATAALALLAEATGEDLVIAVISGGGSSLLTLPQEGICLDDFRATSHALVTGGPAIQDINTVRKHLSRVKGGRLREAAPEAEFLTLILSDVIGDDLSSIASGPTVPDPTTCHDAIRVLEHYHLWERIPEASRACLVRGDPDESTRDALWRDHLEPRTQNVVVTSNAVVLRAFAEALATNPPAGLPAEVVLMAEPVTGTVEAAVKQHYTHAIAVQPTTTKSTLLVYGGEPVVTVPADASGRGGRMLHYALLAAMNIAGTEWTVLASGTDGIDGTAPAAGAVVTGQTIALAEQHGLKPVSYLASFDSYGFFHDLEERTGERFLNITGPTGTNVNDIMLWLV